MLIDILVFLFRQLLIYVCLPIGAMGVLLYFILKLTNKFAQPTLLKVLIASISVVIIPLALLLFGMSLQLVIYRFWYPMADRIESEKLVGQYSIAYSDSTLPQTGELILYDSDFKLVFIDNETYSGTWTYNYNDGRSFVETIDKEERSMKLNIFQVKDTTILGEFEDVKDRHYSYYYYKISDSK